MPEQELPYTLYEASEDTVKEGDTCFVRKWNVKSDDFGILIAKVDYVTNEGFSYTANGKGSYTGFHEMPSHVIVKETKTKPVVLVPEHKFSDFNPIGLTRLLISQGFLKPPVRRRIFSIQSISQHGGLA